MLRRSRRRGPRPPAVVLGDERRFNTAWTFNRHSTAWTFETIKALDAFELPGAVRQKVDIGNVSTLIRRS
jgi:hypothetical protein